MMKKRLWGQIFCFVLVSGIVSGCSGAGETVLSTEDIPEAVQMTFPEEISTAADETERQESLTDTEETREQEETPEDKTEETREQEETPEDKTEEPREQEETSEDETTDEETQGMDSETSSDDAEQTEGKPEVQTGILSYELSHPEFLQILYDGDESGYDRQLPYYGGNQAWFYNADTGVGDAQLEQEGCGLIAAADTMLYLSLYHEGFENLTAPSTFSPDSALDYHAYKDYVLALRAREDLFPFSVQFGGALGTNLADGITRYGKEQGYTLTAKWGGRARSAGSLSYVNEASAEAMLSGFLEGEELEESTGTFLRKTNTILDMLQKDIPVIMAIGPFSEMNLYQFSMSPEGEKSLECEGTVGSHYFIVTGATVDFDAMRIFMTIETWGETYVIDYLEFTKETCNGMTLLSDILYLDLE